MSDNKALTVRDPQEARDLVQKYRSENQLVFVSEEDLQTQSAFIPAVVAVHAEQTDFHNISGKMMPKRELKDRIAEAAGIVFLEQNCGTRTENVDGNTVYVGYAQAKKRMPDGTWRTSSVCEYEFDPIKRAEEDFLRDTRGKYKTEKDQKLAILNYQKFGRQRASTGARLRVINELTGMPTALEPNQVRKALVFARVLVNTDRLLEDPATRGEAVKHALGVTQQVYGHADYEVQNGDEPARIEAPEESAVENPADEQWDIPEEPKEDATGIKGAMRELEAFYEQYKSVLPVGPKGWIEDELQKKEHDLEVVSSLLDRAQDWEQRYLQQKGGRSS
jgi:hypothetical protein